MIKNTDGTALSLPGYNPLMAAQASNRLPSDNDEYINWDLFGVAFREQRPPAAPPLPQMQPAVERRPPPPAMPVTKSRNEPPPETEPVIRNEDGTQYDLDEQGRLDVYDPASADKQLMDCVNSEIIGLSGAPIEYYRVMIDSRMDDLYMEQRQKVIAGVPVAMTAVYEPTTPDLALGGLGPAVFDSIEQMTFYVSKTDFIAKVGEMPRVQALVRTRDDDIYWEVNEVKVNFAETERKLWSKHMLGLVCTKWRPNITDQTSPDGRGGASPEPGRRPVQIR